MQMPESLRPSATTCVALASMATLVMACSMTSDAEPVGRSNGPLTAPELLPELDADVSTRLPKYARIRDVARENGLADTAYLLAGIAITETGLVHCWSEATWACKGPSSSDCSGGPVIAGAADGPCSAQQGGLGMFQFDAGTYAETIALYGNDVLSLAGQVPLVMRYVVAMVKSSNYIPGVQTEEDAKAWLASFDVNDPILRDRWIRTVVRHYNGCQPTWSCWEPRLRTYDDGLSRALEETQGTDYWRAPASAAR